MSNIWLHIHEHGIMKSIANTKDNRNKIILTKLIPISEIVEIFLSGYENRNS